MPQAQKFRPPKPKARPVQEQSQSQSLNQSQTQSQVAGTSTRTTSSEQQHRSQAQASTIGFDQTTSTRAMHRLVGDILGSVFYVRSIIPDDNFIETSRAVPQRVRPNGSITPATHLPIKRFRNNYSDVLSIYKFVRKLISRSEASDVIGWLDFGILGALDKKYLKSLIVVVYLKEETRNKAIEAYTFNFTYGDDLSVAEQMDQLNVGGSQSQSSRSRNMREAFETSTRRMMREVWRNAGTMTELPHEVTFDFKIFFTDDTPSDYQPVAFQDDESEIFLATHASDEVPATYDTETTASTGFHNMTCHIASIAHWLPPKGEMEIDPTANENEVQEQKTHLNRTHQREVEDDDFTRDILWPLEQTIYGTSSSTMVDSSQLESVTVEPIKAAGFSSPVGQILPDGTIMAIPKLQQRWSDEADEMIVGRARPGPLQRHRSFRDVLVTKPGLEAWNMPTQSATQDQSQNKTQNLQRDESMQIETAASTMASIPQRSQMSSAIQALDIVLETEMERDQDPLPDLKGKGKARNVDQEPPSSQSTESSNTGPTTPDEEEFDLTTLSAYARPRSPIRRRHSSAKSNSSKTSKTKTKTKSKPKAKAPPTAFQISAAMAPIVKAKPKTKKRVQSSDGAIVKPSLKATKGKKTSSSTADIADPKLKANKPITNATKGATIINRVAPRTFAAMDPSNSPIENPDDMQIDPFPLSLDSAHDSILQSQTQSQTQTQQSQQGGSSQTARYHPYAGRQASAGPSSQSSSASQRVLPVPRTHMKRMRSSRGIRGVDFSRLESKRPLPVIAEEP